MFLIFLAVFIILVLLVILAAVKLRQRRRARRRLIGIDPGVADWTVRIRVKGDPDRWIYELESAVRRKAAAAAAAGDDHLKEPLC